MVADTLRTGDDALCISCGGSGRNGGYGVCERCNGKGAVCPACQGMRFLRQRRTHAQPWETEVVRCPVCCEGERVNEVGEIQAIRAYIARSDVPHA